MARPSQRSLSVARSLSITCALGLAIGCAHEPLEPDCSQDRCESVDSRDELLAALDGFADPVARMLRDRATERGTLAGDYRTVLDDLGAITGCDRASEKSFVVLSNADFIPKMVFARCADQPQLASQFFVALPAIDGDRDMEPQALHLSGWDPEAGRYRHYAAAPDRESGEMAVNVQPTFCMGCHGGPERLEVWQPLMNEMTNPWSGWNAEPGFASNLFDEYLDPDTAAGDDYHAMTESLDSASNLEPLVRAGLARYVSARVRDRDLPASIDGALDLLRPLFCDEMVNYVSEVHDSGELRSAAFIDDATRRLLLQSDPTLAYDWLHADAVRLAPPSAGDPPVSLIPTRSESAVQTELALASRRVLDPVELLRARAIDWTRPVASELRCQIYRDGRARIEAGALDANITALPEEATTADLLAPVYDELLRDYPLGPSGELTAVRDGAASMMSIADFAAALDQYLAGLDRAALRATRDQRACWAEGRYLYAPIIPDLSCD